MEDNVVMPEIGLRLCVVLQQGKVEEAVALLPQLYKMLETAVPTVYFDTIKNILSTASRKRCDTLFLQILQDKQQPLLVLVEREGSKDLARRFLDFLVFTVCDRRLEQARQIVQTLVEGFTRNLPEDRLLSFCNEWTSLIARIARRQWQEETDWLLTTLLHQLWRYGDVKLYQKVIWQLQMHVAMYCRYDSFEGMLKLYHRLFSSYLKLIGFAEKKYIARNLRAEWLQVALRSFSEMVLQLARVQMLEEQEIYQKLYNLLCGADKEEKTKRELRWLHLLQLSITYWWYRHPKSSRRQVEYLDNIMKPYAVCEECRELLARMA